MQTAAALDPSLAVSPLRISAWSVALGLHLGALGLLLMPASLPLSAVSLAEPAALRVEITPRASSPPPPAPPIPTPPQRTSAVPTPLPLPPIPVATTIEVAPASMPSAPAGIPVDAMPATVTATSDASVAIGYDHVPPPPYPALAKRRGWEGDVLLRVRVDVDGRPREVVVEQGSGHTLLDRRAVEHVLARWRFRPARLDGAAVEAWARVPVSFRLQRI